MKGQDLTLIIDQGESDGKRGKNKNKQKQCNKEKHYIVYICDYNYVINSLRKESQESQNQLVDHYDGECKPIR